MLILLSLAEETLKLTVSFSVTWASAVLVLLLRELNGRGVVKWLRTCFRSCL